MSYSFAKYCDSSIVSVKDRFFEYSSVCSASQCSGQQNVKNRYNFIIADITKYIDCEPVTIPCDCTIDSVRDMMELVPTIDWSFWHNIYDVNKGESKYSFRTMERAGCLMRCNEDGGYYTVSMFMGTKKNVEDIPIDNITQIHSHPAELTRAGYVTTNCLPSMTDYKCSIGKLSILVTIRGVIVYGTPKRYDISNVSSDETIASDIIKGNLICEFISWVDLGYKKHSYIFEHNDKCDLVVCKCHCPSAYNDECIMPTMFIYNMYGNLIDYGNDYTKSQYDTECYHKVSSVTMINFDQ